MVSDSCINDADSVTIAHSFSIPFLLTPQKDVDALYLPMIDISSHRKHMTTDGVCKPYEADINS